MGDFDDRMRAYEQTKQFTPKQPIIVRVDGLDPFVNYRQFISSKIPPLDELDIPDD